MTEEKITVDYVRDVFFDGLNKFKIENGESKVYSFSRAILDDFLHQEFPNSSKTERSNAISSFLKSQGLYIRKVSHGQYEYIDEKDLTKRFILDTISKALEKIEDAKINVDAETNSKELKSLCFLAITAEDKLKNVLYELLKLVPELEAEYKKKLQDSFDE